MWQWWHLTVVTWDYNCLTPITTTKVILIITIPFITVKGHNCTVLCSLDLGCTSSKLAPLEQDVYGNLPHVDRWAGYVGMDQDALPLGTAKVGPVWVFDPVIILVSELGTIPRASCLKGVDWLFCFYVYIKFQFVSQSPLRHPLAPLKVCQYFSLHPMEDRLRDVSHGLPGR